MRLPKTIQILGRKYKIQSAFNMELDGRPSGGQIHFGDRTIYLDTQSADHIIEEMLFHEVGHIGADVSGIDQRLPPELVEIIVQTMANTFLDLHKQLCRRK